MNGSIYMDFEDEDLILSVGNKIAIQHKTGDIEQTLIMTMKQFEELDDEYRNQVNELSHKNKEDKILKLEAENEELKYQLEMRDTQLFEMRR